jgi:hypothetical protein
MAYTHTPSVGRLISSEPLHSAEQLPIVTGKLFALVKNKRRRPS